MSNCSPKSNSASSFFLQLSVTKLSSFPCASCASPPQPGSRQKAGGPCVFFSSAAFVLNGRIWPSRGSPLLPIQTCGAKVFGVPYYNGSLALVHPFPSLLGHVARGISSSSLVPLRAVEPNRGTVIKPFFSWNQKSLQFPPLQDAGKLYCGIPCNSKDMIFLRWHIFAFKNPGSPCASAEFHIA